jgi:hypothetical protein
MMIIDTPLPMPCVDLLADPHQEHGAGGEGARRP